MAFFRKLKEAADKVGHEATEVGLNIGGFTTGVVGPALQTAGHAVAAGACHVVGQGDAAAWQAEQMRHAASNVQGGFARYRGVAEPWFRGEPGQPGPWMQALPDDRPLTTMFLPGTHDSAAMHGGDFAECQCWTLEQQLEAGIRCFDIRLRHVDDELCCHHGVVYQERQMGGVAAAFENFLAANPSEVLLVRLSGDGCSHDGCHSRSFEEEVRQRFQRPEMWIHPEAWPQLGDVRGKVVLFSCGMGLRNGIDKQDKWELGDHSDKLEEVLAHGRKERSPGTLYVSYTSSQGKDDMGYITPSGVAYHVNRGFFENLDSLQPSVYMMDFPGAELIQKIIARN